MGRRINGPAVSFFAFQDIITSVVGIFVLITLIMMIELVSKTVEGQTNGNRVADTLSVSLNSLEAELHEMRQRSEELSFRSKSVAGIQRFNVEEIRSDFEKRIRQVQEQTKRSEAVNEKLRKVVVAKEGELDQLNQQAVAADARRDELKTVLEKVQYLDSKIGNLTTGEPLVFRNSVLAGRSLIVADVQPKQIEVLELARNVRQVFSGSDRLTKFNAWVDTQPTDKFHFLLLVRPGAASSSTSIQSQLDSVGASFGFDVIGANRSIKLRSEVRN